MPTLIQYRKYSTTAIFTKAFLHVKPQSKSIVSVDVRKRQLFGLFISFCIDVCPQWCFKAFHQVYECSFQYKLVYQHNLGFCLKAGLLHLCQKLPEAIEQALYPGPVAHASLDRLLLPQVFTSRLQQLNLGYERESHWRITVHQSSKHKLDFDIF